MVRVSLKRRVLECLFVIFVIDVVFAYFCIAYPISVFNPEYYRSNILPSYYAAAFGTAFIFVFVYFLAPKFLVRRCRKCGSKNMFFSMFQMGISDKRFFCGDCNYALDFNKDLNDSEKLNFLAWAFGVSFSIIGVCGIMGCALAGVLDRDLVRLGVLFSVWPASLTIMFWGFVKVLGKIANRLKITYIRERKRRIVAAVAFLLTFIVLAILLLWVYATLIGMIIT